MDREHKRLLRLVLAATVALGVAANAALHAPAAAPDAPISGGERPGITPAPSGLGNPDRLREGTKIANEAGVFQKKGGDRYTFRANLGKREFACLENLNLERIAAVVADNPDAEWLVSGAVTEYRGTNCLLISQAVLKAKSGRVAGQ